MESVEMPTTETETQLPPSRLLLLLGVAVSLMHLWFNVGIVLSSLWQNSLHFAGFALMASLVYPLRKNPTLVWKGLDILLGLLASGSAIYLIAMEDAIYARGVRMVPAEWIAGIILILCALEFTRRVAGWFIPVLILVALSYVGRHGERSGFNPPRPDLCSVVGTFDRLLAEPGFQCHPAGCPVRPLRLCRSIGGIHGNAYRFLGPGADLWLCRSPALAGLLVGAPGSACGALCFQLAGITQGPDGAPGNGSLIDAVLRRRLFGIRIFYKFFDGFNICQGFLLGNILPAVLFNPGQFL